MRRGADRRACGVPEREDARRRRSTGGHGHDAEAGTGRRLSRAHRHRLRFAHGQPRRACFRIPRIGRFQGRRVCRKGPAAVLDRAQTVRAGSGARPGAASPGAVRVRSSARIDQAERDVCGVGRKLAQQARPGEGAGRAREVESRLHEGDRAVRGPCRPSSRRCGQSRRSRRRDAARDAVATRADLRLLQSQRARCAARAQSARCAGQAAVFGSRQGAGTLGTERRGRVFRTKACSISPTAA